jgi:hypothetical protein
MRGVNSDRTGKAMANFNPPRYTTRIIKAGALIADTKTLFFRWDVEQSVDENLCRVRRQNLLGKTSRSRLEDILLIMRQRYLGEESVARALACLVKSPCSRGSVDRILYFHAAKADCLLRDVVLEILVPKWRDGITQISVTELHRKLYQWVAAGKTTTAWTQTTIRRVAQGLLSTLRDFGVLQGAVKKRIGPAYLPLPAFCYIAFYLKQKEVSGAKLLDATDWKLFFLTPESVERLLVEANQHGLLEYHAAGSVARLTFPATTIDQYAHVLARATA